MRVLAALLGACFSLFLTSAAAQTWRSDFDAAEDRLDAQLRDLETYGGSRNFDLSPVICARARDFQFSEMPLSENHPQPLTPRQKCEAEQREMRARIRRDTEERIAELRRDKRALAIRREQNEAYELAYAKQLDETFGLTKAGIPWNDVLASAALSAAGFKVQAGSDGHVREKVATADDVQASKMLLRASVYQAAAVPAAGEWVGVICNGATCATVVPWVLPLFILADSLVDELNKDRPFGPNNEITKFLRWGPGNEIRRFFEFGPNNEIRKVLSKPLGGRCSFVRNPFGRGC